MLWIVRTGGPWRDLPIQFGNWNTVFKLKADRMTIEPRPAATIFPRYNTVSIEGLILDANNVRTHSDTQVARIAASIREFGFINPILVDGEGGVIADHRRLLAVRKLSMTEVPVIELSHLTPAQRRAYILADNKLSLNAGWDDDRLRLELDALQDIGFDLDLVGFSTAELDTLFAVRGSGLTDPDHLPDMPDVPVSRTGDV